MSSRQRAPFVPSARVYGRADNDSSQSVSSTTADANATTTVDVSTTHNARDPGFLSWTHISANLLYVLVFFILITYTILTWVLYSKTHSKQVPAESTAPGSKFDQILLACAILGTVSVAFTMFVIWWMKPARVALSHYTKYTS